MHARHTSTFARKHTQNSRCFSKLLLLYCVASLCCTRGCGVVCDRAQTRHVLQINIRSSQNGASKAKSRAKRSKVQYLRLERGYTKRAAVVVMTRRGRGPLSCTRLWPKSKDVSCVDLPISLAVTICHTGNPYYAMHSPLPWWTHAFQGLSLLLYLLTGVQA